MFSKTFIVIALCVVLFATVNAAVSTNMEELAVDDDSVCDMCVEVMTRAKGLVKYGKGFVEKYLAEECTEYLPSFACDTITDMIDNIVAWLMKETPPKQICQDIDLCKK